MRTIGRGQRGTNDGGPARPRASQPVAPKNCRYYLDLKTDDFGTVYVHKAGEDLEFLGEVKLTKDGETMGPLATAALVGALGAIARGHALKD